MGGIEKLTLLLKMLEIYMLQVLQEEDMPALHSTEICRMASNGGDLQWIQTLGTYNQGRAHQSRGHQVQDYLLDVRVVGCGLITHTKNKGSIDKWHGLGKVGTEEAHPRSDKPEPFDKSSRGQSTSIPPCPTPIWSTDTKLQQLRRV